MSYPTRAMTPPPSGVIKNLESRCFHLHLMMMMIDDLKLIKYRQKVCVNLITQDSTSQQKTFN